MAYRALYGGDLEYPHAIAGPHHTWNEQTRRWVAEYQRLFSHMQDCEREIITLREQNKRLQHENDFMLKLINREPAP